MRSARRARRVEEGKQWQCLHGGTNLSWLGWLAGASSLLILGAVCASALGSGYVANQARRQYAPEHAAFGHGGARLPPWRQKSLSRRSGLTRATHSEAPAIAEVTGPRFVEPRRRSPRRSNRPLNLWPPAARALRAWPRRRPRASPTCRNSPAPTARQRVTRIRCAGRNDMDVAPSGVPGIFGVFAPGIGPVTIATMAAAAPDVAMPEEPDRAVAAPVAALPPMLPAVEPPRPALTDISQLPKLAYIPMPLPTGRVPDALTALARPGYGSSRPADRTPRTTRRRASNCAAVVARAAGAAGRIGGTEQSQRG